jgi:hypothetical protein
MNSMRSFEIFGLLLLSAIFIASLFYQPSAPPPWYAMSLARAASQRPATIWLLLTTAACLAAMLVPRWRTAESSLIVQGCLIALAFYCLLIYGSGFAAAYIAIAARLRLRQRAAA